MIWQKANMKMPENNFFQKKTMETIIAREGERGGEGGRTPRDTVQFRRDGGEPYTLEGQNSYRECDHEFSFFFYVCTRNERSKRNTARMGH